MNLEAAYRTALAAVGRPERRLAAVHPEGWRDGDRARAMLVLVGGWVFDFGDWPAFALLLPRGSHLLGHTHPRAAFPKVGGIPKLFEGSQCELEVADEVRIVEDLSTNGTLLIPPEHAKATPDLRLTDELREQWDAPCPKSVHLHDVVLTQYAELVLVGL